MRSNLFQICQRFVRTHDIIFYEVSLVKLLSLVDVTVQLNWFCNISLLFGTLLFGGLRL